MRAAGDIGFGQEKARPLLIGLMRSYGMNFDKIR